MAQFLLDVTVLSDTVLNWCHDGASCEAPFFCYLEFGVVPKGFTEVISKWSCSSLILVIAAFRASLTSFASRAAAPLRSLPLAWTYL